VQALPLITTTNPPAWHLKVCVPSSLVVLTFIIFKDTPMSNAEDLDDRIPGLEFLRGEKPFGRATLTSTTQIDPTVDSSDAEIAFDFLRGKSVAAADIAYVKQEPPDESPLQFLRGKTLPAVDLAFATRDAASKGKGRAIIDVDAFENLSPPRIKAEVLEPAWASFGAPRGSSSFFGPPHTVESTPSPTVESEAMDASLPFIPDVTVSPPSQPSAPTQPIPPIPVKPPTQAIRPSQATQPTPPKQATPPKQPTQAIPPTQPTIGDDHRSPTTSDLQGRRGPITELLSRRSSPIPSQAAAPSSTNPKPSDLNKPKSSAQSASPYPAAAASSSKVSSATAPLDESATEDVTIPWWTPFKYEEAALDWARKLPNGPATLVMRALAIQGMETHPPPIAPFLHWSPPTKDHVAERDEDSMEGVLQDPPKDDCMEELETAFQALPSQWQASLKATVEGSKEFSGFRLGMISSAALESQLIYLQRWLLTLVQHYQRNLELSAKMTTQIGAVESAIQFRRHDADLMTLFAGRNNVSEENKE
jgi:hypothetical protein